MDRGRWLLKPPAAQSSPRRGGTPNTSPHPPAQHKQQLKTRTTGCHAQSHQHCTPLNHGSSRAPHTHQYGAIAAHAKPIVNVLIALSSHIGPARHRRESGVCLLPGLETPAPHTTHTHTRTRQLKNIEAASTSPHKSLTINNQGATRPLARTRTCKLAVSCWAPATGCHAADGSHVASIHRNSLLVPNLPRLHIANNRHHI